MLSMARPAGAQVVAQAGGAGGTPGKQTIVIAAPKSGVAGAQPQKIITTVPKLSTSTTGTGK